MTTSMIDSPFGLFSRWRGGVHTKKPRDLQFKMPAVDGGCTVFSASDQRQGTGPQKNHHQ
jgi:hypothetical protein